MGLLKGELCSLDTLAVHYRCFSFRIGYKAKTKRPKTHDNISFPVGLRPDSVSCPPLTVLCDHTHWTHTHTHTHSVGLLWTSDKVPLPDNTQRSQETSTLPAGFEPAVPTSEQPQTYALDRATTGIGHGNLNVFSFFSQTALLRICHVFQKHSLLYILLHYFFDLVLKTQ